MDTEEEYTYKYCSWVPEDPEEASAIVELNLRASMRMDVIRSSMGPTAPQLRDRVLRMGRVEPTNLPESNGRQT